MSEKLPIFATLGAAFRCVMANRKRILPYVGALVIAGVAAVVIAFMAGAGAILVGKIGGEYASPQAGAWVVFAVLMLGYGALSIPITNSLQRLAVQGEAARFGFGYAREEWMAIWATVRVIFAGTFVLIVSMLVVIIPTFLLAMLLGGEGKGFLIMAFAPLLAIIPFSIIFPRIMLVMPAAANGLSLSLWDSFTLTKGNSWRLFAVYLLVAIPCQIVQQMMFALIGRTIGVAAVSMIISLIVWIYSVVVIAVVFKHFQPNLQAKDQDSDAEIIPDPVI